MKAAKSTADLKGDTVIIDHTEINTVQLRRTIYLTIQSSVDFEECVHKLLKLQIPEKMWKGKIYEKLKEKKEQKREKMKEMKKIKKKMQTKMKKK